MPGRVVQYSKQHTQNRPTSQDAALKALSIYAIDGSHYLNRSGPRLVESAELLAHVLWGERLGIEVDAYGWRHVT